VLIVHLQRIQFNFDTF